MMERYSEYKDSGVKWLGEIPSHWEVLKSKFLWRETFENSQSGKEDLLSVSQYTGVTKSMADSRSESLEGYKIVHKDELVINIMLAWLGGLGVSDFEGVVSPAYCTYKLIRNENPKFLHYLYKTSMYLAEFARHSTGVVPSRWRMYTDDFGQVLSLLPPLSEQDAIVRYLDSATSEIDKAIAMQQKMIDLLNERKQIIIQNAVTKGLDENVEMKESGVEWIGRIPKHWEVNPLRKYLKVCSKRNMPDAQLLSVTREEGVIVRNIESKEENHNYIPDDLSNYKYVQKGQFVINKMKSWKGSYGVSNYDGIVSPAYFVYDLMYYNKEYFSLAIRSKKFSPFFSKYSKGIRIDQWDLMPEALKIIPFLEPPVEEQNAIVHFLEDIIPRINDNITNCQRQITLLQERKQIIINEVVTGKVRVS